MKRKAVPSPFVYEKRSRSSIASGFEDLREGLDNFTGVFASVAAGRPVGVEATPVRKDKAIKRMEQLETDLDDMQKLDLMDLFTKDVKMADAYLSMEGEGLRKRWVERRLGEATQF